MTAEPRTVGDLYDAVMAARTVADMVTVLRAERKRHGDLAAELDIRIAITKFPSPHDRTRAYRLLSDASEEV